MVALVSRLQDENRRIQKLQESPPREVKSIESQNDQSASSSAQDASANLLSATDFQTMQRLRNQIAKQREELKNRDEKLQLETNEIESVSCPVGVKTISESGCS